MQLGMMAFVPGEKQTLSLFLHITLSILKPVLFKISTKLLMYNKNIQIYPPQCLIFVYHLNLHRVTSEELLHGVRVFRTSL